MKKLILVLCFVSSFAHAARSRELAADRDAATLKELQRTLEMAAAAEDQSSNAEAPINERSRMQAADHPEFRED